MSGTKWYDTQLLKNSVAITDYLASKGFEPVKSVGNELAYFSPFREEKTPSFFVNPRENVFNDFGSHEKGDVIRLVRLLENKTFAESCKLLENFQGLHSVNYQRPKKTLIDTHEKTLIRRVSELYNPTLIRYIEGRQIPIALARKYLSEIHYTRQTETNEANFYAVGFRNNTNGYELRTAQFKGCTGSKDIRFIQGQKTLADGCGVLILFEGFFDFLSFLTHKRLNQPPYDTIVLNSTSQLYRALPTIEQYNSIVAYLDNDVAGERTLIKIIEETRIPTLNASAKYFPNFKDYNDFLCQQKP